jgi:hypothetical protein
MLFGAEPPSSKTYDLVLLVHVALAMVALIGLISSAAAARSLQTSQPGRAWPASAARYFAPGSDLVGRVLYLIPLSGAALLGMSQGAYSISDAFVGIGLGLWVLVALLAELAVFATSARLRRTVAASPIAPEDEGWRRDAVVLRWGVDGVVLLIVAASVLMVAQP